MLSSPPRLPVDVLLLPALWPVRLTREQRVQLARELAGEECAEPTGC